jgi:hypothetical protein
MTERSNPGENRVDPLLARPGLLAAGLVRILAAVPCRNTLGTLRMQRLATGEQPQTLGTHSPPPPMHAPA